MDLEIFSILVILQSPNLLYTIKLLIKHGRQKNQEKSAHRFGDKYLINLRKSSAG